PRLPPSSRASPLHRRIRQPTPAAARKARGHHRIRHRTSQLPPPSARPPATRQSGRNSRARNVRRIARGSKMNALSRLNLWQKLTVLVVAMAVPTVLLGFFYLSGANTQVALARDEIEGARYVQSVGAVLAQVTDHRSRLFTLLTGDTAHRDEVTSSEL